MQHRKGHQYMLVLIIGDLTDEVLQLNEVLNDYVTEYVHHVSRLEKVLSQVKTPFIQEMDIIIIEVEKETKFDKIFYKKVQYLTKSVNAPVLLFIDTNALNHETIAKMMDAGIFDMIPKPVDNNQIIMRMNAAARYQTEKKLQLRSEMNLQMELNFAKKLQKQALSAPLHTKRIDIDGLNYTSEALGGDMYNWYKINEHLYAVILYDVMGHGFASALVAMSMRSLLKGIITRLIDPVGVITELNHRLYELFSNEEESNNILMTAIYVLIDLKNGVIHYVNAASPEGFLLGKYGETVLLHANAPILGFIPNIHVEKKTIRVNGWNRIILYSDGLHAINDHRQIESQIFQPYVSFKNHTALEGFAKKYKLFQKHFPDDISIVSITFDLKGRSV